MEEYSIELHRLAANTIRGLAIDAIQKANSGHPGMPMGMADLSVVLWSRFLKHNPKDPAWFDRDRFVLSAGHGSMLLYSLLHLSGYDLSLEDLQSFRQWGSITPGHPENHLTPGVETTTGPLGQGISNAVGMALAERWLAERFNRPGFQLVDHHTYAIASDGDLMEGISHEASSLAGHWGLGKLIVFYDDNHITIDGPTSLTFSEDVLARYEAYGWHTLQVDGHNPASIADAVKLAQAETHRPSLIACRTHIGYGSPNRQDTSAVHGSPLGETEARLTKENLGWPLEPLFHVPDAVRDLLSEAGMRGAERQAAWETLLSQYVEAFPDLAAMFHRFVNGTLPDEWEEILPIFEAGNSLATRASSGQTLNAIAPYVPQLVGGSADLTESNKTDLKGEEALSSGEFGGRYIHFGIREHGMGGILNGMALHGGIRPYGGTFLVFSDYMRPSVRLAALMGLPVIYVFSHDSIGLGEDGPTHQPVEQLMALRTIPNLTLIRPADATETAVAWQAALENRSGPTALVLTRQGVPTLDRSRYASAANLRKGAYVLSEPSGQAQVILIGTGSELHLALEAQALLETKGVATRVVSMPSWELFEQQTETYRNSVLPAEIMTRVSVEAGVTLGWERYIGTHGRAIGLDRFGASAPYQTIYEKVGITANAVANTALALIS